MGILAFVLENSRNVLTGKQVDLQSLDLIRFCQIFVILDVIVQRRGLCVTWLLGQEAIWWEVDYCHSVSLFVYLRGFLQYYFMPS